MVKLGNHSFSIQKQNKSDRFELVINFYKGVKKKHRIKVLYSGLIDIKLNNKNIRRGFYVKI